jgi:iron complex transport system substrate-binding protein
VQNSGATALFVMVWEDRISIFLPESRFHMIYDEFGFASAKDELPEWGDQHGFDARAEFILSVNPDVILLLDRTDMTSPTGGVGVQTFMADSIIQSTSAAQNGSIFVLEGNAWYTVTGGFGATETKIANIMAFVNT